MNENTTTEDTAEKVSVPALPVDDSTGDGYDWLETTYETVWSVMGAWGTDGWDAGSWPCVFFLTGPGHQRHRGPVRVREVHRRRPRHPLVPQPGRLPQGDHR